MDLKHINKKLNDATALLDEIAKDLADTGLVQRKAWIQLIGESLCSIVELQHGIYLESPELKPGNLDEEPIDKSANRHFGDILIGIQGILPKNRPLDAIEVLETFISKNPPDYLVAHANNEIEKIRKDFNL